MRDLKTMFGGGLAVLFLLALATFAFAGGGAGEGDPCDADLTYANLNPPYTGTVIGIQACMPFCGLYIYTPEGSPLTRQGGKCAISIPQSSPVYMGIIPYLPEKPSDIAGICTQSIRESGVDMCSYSALLYGHVVIDASNPQKINDNTVMFNIKLMPITAQ